MSVKGTSRTAVRYTLLVVVLLVMAFPLVWMFRVALLDPSSSINLEAMFGSGLTFNNFTDLFADISLGRNLFNSIVVGVAVTVGNILFCFMTAYSLARYRWIVNKLLFGSVIAVLMIPVHVVIIPLYILCVKTGLYNTYFALILPFLVNPIGIFLVKQYISGLPPSIEEAARIDGAGELYIVFRVVMPLCRPALAVLAIQVFFTNWNSFLLPFILTSDAELRTLPVALALLQGHQAIDWPHLMAGSTVAVLPVLVTFLFLQRQIVAGITAGAVKQ